MHHVQRSLIDFIVVGGEDLEHDHVGLLVLQGTTLLVPVLEAEGVPVTQQPIGWPGHLSGLVVGDLEAEEVVDLLSREGLGVQLGVTWDGGWHRGELQVHAPDVDAAVAALAAALEGSVPDGGVITRAAAQRAGDWPARERRDVGGGVTVAAPSDDEPAMALVSWSLAEGDVFGVVLAEPEGDWMASLADALDLAREAGRGAAPHVRVDRPRIDTGMLWLKLWAQAFGPDGPRTLAG
jgi:hypothetical protein